jgi:hypothetical protein|tara:strand:+ start:5382 stop:5519 length:138 start_codon:yes stop_codon:yes gene_type:complete
MEKEDIEQYVELMNDVEKVKKALSLNDTNTALLLMMYDKLDILSI